MDELGGNTRDLNSLGRPHPAEQHLPAASQEARIHRLGTIWLVSGVGILAIAVTVILSIAVLMDDIDVKVCLFVSLVGMLIAATGGALLTAGMVERIDQPKRTLVRRAAARADLNAELGETNRESVDSLAALVHLLVGDMGAVRRSLTDNTQAVTERLELIEKAIGNLPDYGAGVLDGVQMRNEALGGGS